MMSCLLMNPPPQSDCGKYLYSAMEDYRIDIMIDKVLRAFYSVGVEPVYLDWRDYPQRFANCSITRRFGINCHFEYYDAKVITGIIKRSAGLLDIPIAEDAAKESTSRSRGTPRIANALLGVCAILHR